MSVHRGGLSAGAHLLLLASLGDVEALRRDADLDVAELLDLGVLRAVVRARATRSA